MSYQEYKRERQQKIHDFKDELRKYANPSAKTVFRYMIMYNILAVTFQHFTRTCYPHFEAKKIGVICQRQTKLQGLFKKINVIFTIPSVSISCNCALNLHDGIIVRLSLHPGSI